LELGVAFNHHVEHDGCNVANSFELRVHAMLQPLLVIALLVLPVQEKGGLRPRQGTLKVGDAAPVFTLKQLDASKSVDLGKLQGKPTLLVFGSCT
jgi:hypothetical protein